MELINLIPTLGFPIVAVIALAIFILHIYKDSKTRETELRKEIKENREVNAQAIATIAKYAEKLEVIQTDVNEIKNDVIRITEHLG